MSTLFWFGTFDCNTAPHALFLGIRKALLRVLKRAIFYQLGIIQFPLLSQIGAGDLPPPP